MGSSKRENFSGGSRAQSPRVGRRAGKRSHRDGSLRGSTKKRDGIANGRGAKGFTIASEDFNGNLIGERLPEVRIEHSNTRNFFHKKSEKVPDREKERGRRDADTTVTSLARGQNARGVKGGLARRSANWRGESRVKERPQEGSQVERAGQREKRVEQASGSLERRERAPPYNRNHFREEN